MEKCFSPNKVFGKNFFPNTENFYKREVSIPIFPSLKEKEQFRLEMNSTIKYHKTFFENGNLKTEEWIVDIILTELTITV